MDKKHRYFGCSCVGSSYTSLVFVAQEERKSLILLNWPETCSVLHS